MKIWFRWLLVVVCCGGTFSWSQAGVPSSQNWSLSTLMDSISAVKYRSAHFTETKKLSLLEIPLTQTGTLHFSYPDKLVKKTFTPEPSSFEIVGAKLIITQAGAPTQTLMMTDHPQMLAFFESLRAVLAGDLPALQSHFKTRLEGTSSDWKLILLPAEGQLAKWIRQIEIHGAAAQVKRYIVLEQSGDESLTTLKPINTQ
jgi:hypothetical protein